MANPQDVIKAFMASLNNTTLSGAAAVDEAVRACSDFDNAQAVIAQMVADRSSTTADDFLLSYCGINLYNEDTGAIISIQSTDTLSAAINLADGSSLRFNHATKAWQNS